MEVEDIFQVDLQLQPLKSCSDFGRAGFSSLRHPAIWSTSETHIHVDATRGAICRDTHGQHGMWWVPGLIWFILLWMYFRQKTIFQSKQLNPRCCLVSPLLGFSASQGWVFSTTFPALLHEVHVMLEGAVHNSQPKPCKRGFLGQMWSLVERIYEGSLRYSDIPHQNPHKKGMQARLFVFDPKFSRPDWRSFEDEQANQLIFLAELFPFISASAKRFSTSCMYWCRYLIPTCRQWGDLQPSFAPGSVFYFAAIDTSQCWTLRGCKILVLCLLNDDWQLVRWKQVGW